MLSIATDYIRDQGEPSSSLRAIAEAGFTHLHWCHQWNTDFLYDAAEIDQIKRWLEEFGLHLADTHGSEGKEKFWYAPQEYARLAGIALVKNRIDFTAKLGGNAVVMHLYPPSQDPQLAVHNDYIFDHVRRSLDDLLLYATSRGITIALENLIDFRGVRSGAVNAANATDNFDLILQLFDHYAPDFLGFCYDSGHAILGQNRMARLAPLMKRLSVLHLNDNDGQDDLHLLPFAGQVDWHHAAQLVAQSPYVKPMSYELSIRHTGITDEARFLEQAHRNGARFANMVDLLRSPAA